MLEGFLTLCLRVLRRSLIGRLGYSLLVAPEVWLCAKGVVLLEQDLLVFLRLKCLMFLHCLSRLRLD